MEVVNPQHLPFELTKEYIEEVRLLIQNQATDEIIQKTEYRLMLNERLA